MTQNRQVFLPKNWTYLTALSQGSLIPIQDNNYNTIRYYFYSLNQLTDHFPSGPGSITIPGDHDLSNGSYQFLLDRYQALGNPPSSINVTAIANETFNYTIRVTASLFHWFCTETGLISKITVANNFNLGTIKFGINSTPQEKTSPYTVGVMNGQQVRLEAQNQLFEDINRIWNSSGVTNSWSNWLKLPSGASIPNAIPGANNYNYSFNVSTNDHNSKYIADLKKRFDITRNDQTEFDGNFTTIAAQIVEQNSDYISAPLQQTINNNSYNFAGWVGWNQSSASVYITPTQNTTYSTLYKIPHKSNYANAFSNNSQRKFVRTPDGTFHLVYESMGCTWYERSTDNGVSWQIMNNGKPLRDNSQNPAIAYQGNTVFIAVQFSTGFKFYWFNNAGGFEAADSVINPGGEVIDYQSDVSPAIEIKSDRLLIVYRNNGLKYNFYQWYPSGNGDISFLEDGLILNSDANSITPTLAVNKNTSDYNFHLAWGQGDNIIRYQKITSSDGIRLEQSSSCYKANLAANDGYTKNYTPTLVVLGDDLARASWIGERNTITDEESINEKRVVFRGVKCDNTSFSFWNFGYDVRSATIQKSNDNANYFIIWNEENNATKATNNTTLAVIKNLSTAGHNVQVCNGATKSDMYGMVFNSASLPYTFNKTNNIQSYFENPSKEQYGNAVYAGRDGTVNKDAANIYYTVGDVLVDGSIINFKEITETTEINSNEDVKRYLETEPFDLNDNSSFLYSVQYGLTENPGGIFNSAEFINFKVKLVDAETNAVISVFDDVNYNANNLLPYNSIQYSVNTNGIGNRTVILMLDIEDNFDAVYSVTSKFSDAEILPKAVRKEVGLGENFNVTEYDLSQNYPNPFNPSTTIRYQIPEDGMVTLMVYDILGREVKTLVNDFKTKGRYEVTFDASRLASGLYIYEITSGSYKASKKMTLIK